MHFECSRVLYEGPFESVFMYGSETLVRRRKKRSGIRAVNTDNLTIIRKIARIPNYI